MDRGINMKVSELIEQLKDIHPDDHVFIWVDGERYAISCIDADFGDNYVDLNAQINEGETA
jgi:hypothetical protein